MTPGREEALKSRLARFANPWTIQIRDRQGRWSESGQRVAMSTPERAPLWRCSLLGCETTSWYPDCVHCGSGVYDLDFIQEGIVWRFWHWILWLTAPLRPVRCANCRRVLARFGSRDFVIDFCSKECEEKWIPF